MKTNQSTLLQVAQVKKFINAVLSFHTFYQVNPNNAYEIIKFYNEVPYHDLFSSILNSWNKTHVPNNDVFTAKQINDMFKERYHCEHNFNVPHLMIKKSVEFHAKNNPNSEMKEIGLKMIRLAKKVVPENAFTFDILKPFCNDIVESLNVDKSELTLNYSFKFNFFHWLPTFEEQAYVWGFEKTFINDYSIETIFIDNKNSKNNIYKFNFEFINVETNEVFSRSYLVNLKSNRYEMQYTYSVSSIQEIELENELDIYSYIYNDKKVNNLLMNYLLHHFDIEIDNREISEFEIEQANEFQKLAPTLAQKIQDYLNGLYKHLKNEEQYVQREVQFFFTKMANYLLNCVNDYELRHSNFLELIKNELVILTSKNKDIDFSRTFVLHWFYVKKPNIFLYKWFKHYCEMNK